MDCRQHSFVGVCAVLDGLVCFLLPLSRIVAGDGVIDGFGGPIDKIRRTFFRALSEYVLQNVFGNAVCNEVGVQQLFKAEAFRDDFSRAGNSAEGESRSIIQPAVFKVQNRIGRRPCAHQGEVERLASARQGGGSQEVSHGHTKIVCR